MVHTYLGIDFYMSIKEKVSLSMINYFKEIIDDFPEVMKGAKTLAATNLFKVNKEAIKLSKVQVERYHQFVAQILWGSLRVCLDTLTALSFLTLRVQRRDEDDWKKPTWLVCYIYSTVDLRLRLTVDDVGIVKWWVDASFKTRTDMRS